MLSQESIEKLQKIYLWYFDKTDHSFNQIYFGTYENNSKCFQAQHHHLRYSTVSTGCAKLDQYSAALTV